MPNPVSDYKCGFVTLIGRPNVGKSTLLNALVRSKVSIVSPVPQTTRYTIRGILSLRNAQIIFVDTPGMHAVSKVLVGALNDVAKGALSDTELVLYVIDVTRRFGEEEAKVMRAVMAAKKDCIIAFNKIDRGEQHLPDYMDAWRKLVTSAGMPDPVKYYIPLSAVDGTNIDRLIGSIVELLPAQQAFYESGTVTDFPLKFRIADAIREQLFLSLHEELPHELAVVVDEITEKKKNQYIHATIYVLRPSQKAIVIGAGGSCLKKAGTAARAALEVIVGRKVFLELKVEVMPNWQKRPAILQELGYVL